MRRTSYLLLMIVSLVGLGMGFLFPPLQIYTADESAKSPGLGEDALWKGRPWVERVRKPTRIYPGKDTVQVPPLEVERLLEENSPEQGKPLRFAERWPVNVTPSSSGRWA